MSLFSNDPSLFFRTTEDLVIMLEMVKRSEGLFEIFRYRKKEENVKKSTII